MLNWGGWFHMMFWPRKNMRSVPIKAQISYFFFYAAKSSNSLPAIWDNLSVPSSRVKKPNISLPLKMGPLGCQETLVRNYHSTLLNIPEECWSHVHHDRSLKSCKKKYIFILRKIYKTWRLTNKWQFNTLPTRWPFNSLPSFPIHFTHFKCSMPNYILTYSLTVYMILLNSVLRKLHIESLAGPNGELFHKPRPFVKQNTGFTNLSSFTSLMCNMYFTWSCRILLLALPTSKNFVQFVFGEIPGESAWGVQVRPPWCCLLPWPL